MMKWRLADDRTEEEIGVMPPRADFMILVEDEEVEFDKEILKIFRQTNILEYKNPYDSLNERVIRKVCGYANLYIGVAEHEGDRPPDQVTISIFRAVKNPELFARMEQDGTRDHMISFQNSPIFDYEYRRIFDWIEMKSESTFDGICGIALSSKRLIVELLGNLW